MTTPETSACEKCDNERRAAGRTWQVGKPCDICGGSRWDYLARPCRHCNLKGVRLAASHVSGSVSYREDTR